MPVTKLSPVVGRIVGLLLMAVVATAATACSQGAAAPPSPTLIKLTFAVAAGKDEPILIAQAKGFFQQHGLDVTLKTFSSGAEAGQTVVSGQAQMGHVGDFPIMRQAEASGHAIVVVAPFEADSELYVGVVNSAIRSAADLKGKTIATVVGSVPEYLLAKYLEANGMSESDVTVKKMNAPDMPVALDKGSIDGFFVWEPFGLQATKLSGTRVHVLTTGKDLMRGRLIIAADAKWARANQGAVQAFLGALKDAIAYTNAHPDEAAAAFVKAYGADTSLATYAIQHETFSLAVDQGFVSDFNDEAAFLQKVKLLKGPIDWSSFADFTALKALDPSLVSAQP